MPEKPTPPEASKARGIGNPTASGREQRRAEALRANLRRRKAQSRDRKQVRSESEPRD